MALRRFIFLFCLLSLPVTSVALAQDRKPLERLYDVGYQTPHDLTLPDQNGQRMAYMSRAKKKGLIVLFSRSVQW